MQTTYENGGSYVALAGIIISILQHFNVVLDQSAVVSVIAAGAIIYGWIHQYFVSRKIAKAARSVGAIK